MNKSRSIKNIVCSLVGQAVTVLAGLILTRLILVEYGSAINGLLNSVTQIFTYFILLEAGIGAASLQAFYQPVASGDSGEISSILAATKKYYDRTSLLYLISIFVFALAYSLGMAGTAAQDGISVGTMVCVIVFTGLGNVVNFKYQGRYKILMQAEGRNYIITNAQTMLQILTCLAKVAAISLGYPIEVVMILGFAVSLLQTGYYWWYIRKNYAWIDRKAEPATIGQKGSVLIHQVSQLVFQNTDVLILTVVCGLKVVSVYAAFKVVVTAVGTLTYNISESVLFILGQEYARDRRKYIQKIDRFDVGYSAVSCWLFAVAYVLYLPFIELYTRGVTDISYVDPKLPLLFIGIELLSSFRRAMQNTINVAGHFQATVSRTVTETVINLTVSLLAVGRFGIYGVLAGTIVALLYRSNDIILYGNRKILGRSAGRSYGIYLTNLLAFLGVWLVSRGLHWQWEGYLDFLVAGVGTAVITGIWFLTVNFFLYRFLFRKEAA